ncbi:MAG: heavy metal translocating P-type ATPase [Alphaproteobacteria bacterium]|nr:heavy metal translocating P-type ATPase [Alphaproteobacteria bacterium]HCQ70510.1 cadmium-translocating P-type ATPase [Rhodospirillaceae bacterium]|tara:strand:+ start:55237 stop:57447 length:2211 start_codon:yes stop_codon:yes gene_type:complete
MEHQSDLSNPTQIHQPIEQGGFDGLVKRHDDGSSSLYVMVRGVHCAACIQKIEGGLNNRPDMRECRLNFSTGRLMMHWDGAADIADDLVHVITDLGYEVTPYDSAAEESALQTEERFLLMCLGVAGFAAGNIMLLSVGLWSTSAETMGEATRNFMHWISAAIALPTILFSGRPFFRSALAMLRKGQTNMDVPISIALTLTGAMSLLGTITHSEHVYFDSAVMLIFFLLIGRYLDFRARKHARSGAADLLATLGGFATIIDNGKTRRIAVKDLKEGMILRLGAGEKAPIDGHLVDGQSEVDTALITGETIPKPVQSGDLIYAGMVNLSAPITLRVHKEADDSLLADIIRLMEKAEQGNARYVRMADRAARFYTPVVHALAAAAFVGWCFVGGMPWQEALMIAITVLIITCPCALGLAVPVVQVIASSKLIRKGILLKSGDALERLAQINAVMLDKTGTLTLGRPQLTGDYAPEDLSLAAALAAYSAHPLAKAVVDIYDGQLPEITDPREHAGRGISAAYKGQDVRLGSRPWCGESSASNDAYMELWLAREGRAPVRFTFTDQLRPHAADVLTRLRAYKIRTIMATGDRQEAADTVAQACGITEYYAQTTPPEKYDIMQRLKDQDGANVLMIGDGMNDAPVLCGADVSIAPGSAIDLAQNAADIIIMGDDFSPIADVYQTARTTQSLVKQNFALAGMYNVIAIPFALAGMVTPLGAALAMSGSSIIVILNSFRLKFLP